jgi:Ala-tRNA(Pro) deacylase
MPWTPDELLAYLAEAGIDAPTVTHPPVFSVEEGRAVWAAIPGAHCKNLFLKDEAGALFLLVALEDAEIRLNRLHRRIGARRLSFARPDLLMEVLGVPPGSVTPFALVNDAESRVTVLVDAALLEHELLNFHPLTNDRTTTIRRDDLLRFLELRGYAARPIDLAPLAA